MNGSLFLKKYNNNNKITKSHYITLYYVLSHVKNLITIQHHFCYFNSNLKVSLKSILNGPQPFYTNNYCK